MMMEKPLMAQEIWPAELSLMVLLKEDKVKVAFLFKDHATPLTVGWQVNQQKAKLIDLEANVTLQERSNGKVDVLKPVFLSKAAHFFNALKLNSQLPNIFSSPKT